MVTVCKKKSSQHVNSAYASLETGVMSSESWRKEDLEVWSILKLEDCRTKYQTRIYNLKQYVNICIFLF